MRNGTDCNKGLGDLTLGKASHAMAYNGDAMVSGRDLRRRLPGEGGCCDEEEAEGEAEDEGPQAEEDDDEGERGALKGS